MSTKNKVLKELLSIQEGIDFISENESTVYPNVEKLLSPISATLAAAKQRLEVCEVIKERIQASATRENGATLAVRLKFLSEYSEEVAIELLQLAKVCRKLEGVL